MRVVFFANGEVGAETIRFVAAERPEKVVGLVVHPAERARAREEAIAASGLGPEAILEATALRTKAGRRWLEERKADVGVTVFFGYIIRKAILEALPQGCLNLHPSMLPYNRGAYPNVWSIVDGTPAGVTLHMLDEGVDTGPVLMQREVAKRATDTGQTLYDRLARTCTKLFKDAWPAFVAGELTPRPQDDQEATHYRRRDVEQIDEIDLDATYTARELIDRLRARTFPPHAGCYFRDGGRKVYMRLELWEDAPAPDGGDARPEPSDD